nr:uncharacterized protein [uncultured Mediterranean phage uvMED]
MTAKIKLNAASGGGSFSLQAPSSSANNRVMTLPDSADGTVLTTTNPKAGNIIQVVNFRKGDHASATITGSSSGSGDWNYTGFSPAITPTVSTSKILMVGHMSMGGDTTSLYIEVMINGSKSAGGPNGDSNGNRRTMHTSTFIEYDRNTTAIPINFVFTPATTATQTYNFRFNHDSTTNKVIYINRSTNSDNNLRQGDSVSHITLMEIAA